MLKKDVSLYRQVICIIFYFLINNKSYGCSWKKKFFIFIFADSVRSFFLYGQKIHAVISTIMTNQFFGESIRKVLFLGKIWHLYRHRVENRNMGILMKTGSLL